MARIRTIKPDAWQDPRVGRLTTDARLLWVVLITMADDDGRFLALPAVIYGHGYPHDPQALQNLPTLLEELETAGLLVFYEADGVTYGWHPKWADHQRINRHTKSKLPAPPMSAQTRVTAGDVRPHAQLTEASPPEGKGKEGKGGEGEGNAPRALPAAAPGPVDVVPSPPPMPDHPDQAVRLLEEAGVHLLDAYQVAELHDRYPDVDLIACARIVIKRHRDRSLRGNPYGYLRGIAVSPDAPRVKPGVVEGDRPSWDEMRTWLNRHVDPFAPALRNLRNAIAVNPPAAHLLAIVGIKRWAAHESGTFEGRQFLRSAEDTYKALDLTDSTHVDDLLRRLIQAAKTGLQNQANGTDPDTYGLTADDLQDAA